LRQVTCEYRHFRGVAHHILGELPRERGDFLAMKARVLAKHGDLLGPEALVRGIDRLRSELVELAEGRIKATRQIRELEVAHGLALAANVALDERYHLAHGEAASLREDLARHQAGVAELAGEVARLQGEEGRLRVDLVANVAEVARQHEEIARLHAEIGRLTELVRAMEGTRAWRAHQWWQGVRPGRGGR
jgi:chromosome segregation ATPase